MNAPTTVRDTVLAVVADATTRGEHTTVHPRVAQRIADALVTAPGLTLTAAAAIHDAVPDIDPDTAPTQQGITFALCTCDDQLHRHDDREKWLDTFDEAWAGHVFYPEGTVHVLRRLVTITPMRPPAAAAPTPVLASPVHPDCTCEHDYLDEGDERRPRLLRIPNADCPIHGSGDPCPECDDGQVVLRHVEGNTGHQVAECSDHCGWSA